MTTFSEKALSVERPASFLANVILPRNQRYYPSPVDWREEILYFLLVDRFSDGRENSRPRLDRTRLSAARQALPSGDPFRWDLWAASGAERFQGGTLKGVHSKLGYLKALGVSALWISPVCKQKIQPDTCHGYEVQDCLEVDPHFGTPKDLCELIAAAHEQGLRVILDIIFRRSSARLENPAVLKELCGCCQYWMAFSDGDGFRIDGLEHIGLEQARNFCGAIKEFAANLGKTNFLLLAEIAGNDFAQDRYLNVLGRNLDAAIDLGQMRLSLNRVAKGLACPGEYFDGFKPGLAEMGSHRNLGNRHVSIVDDHDHAMGDKIRFSSEAASEKQIAAAAALQLLSLGIPCLYYGTEQALSGPEADERKWLPQWKTSNRYLREAMFGPQHPLHEGEAGLAESIARSDPTLPGFGPFGTTGHHCFDQDHPAFRRIAALCALRRCQPALSHGRQYLRPVSFLGRPFDYCGPGEIIAWSRILDITEILCVLNPHGTDARGADIIVDATLNSRPISLFTVIGNTAQAGCENPFGGSYPKGTRVPVLRTSSGAAYIEIRDLGPSETLVLCNHPERVEGDILPSDKMKGSPHHAT
jgi:glycosidase